MNLFLINILFLLTKEEIINNPIKISEHSNPIILIVNTQYYIFTSGEKIIVNKETGEIDSISSFATYSNPYILCRTQENNFYVFSRNNPDNKFFLLTSTGYQIISLPSITFPNSNKYIGYIKEYEYESGNIIKGRKCDIQRNEISHFF